MCLLQVIFPLMKDLLKPAIEHKISSGALEEARLRAAALLSKMFLQYLNKITHLSNFTDLWWQILQFIEMYMRAEDSDLLVSD